MKKYFEPAGWKLNDENGNELTADYTFTKKHETIYANAKRKKARYTVNHLKQDIEKVDIYSTFETETKEGFIDTSTGAEAKTYKGFDLLDANIEQEKIKEDGSTTIDIKYKRKIVNLILDLQGGNTTTTLYDHEGDTKRISGRFESDVSIADPTKECHVFKSWEPPLPKKFLMESNGKKFVAKWELKDVAIIKGDERFDTSQPIYIDISSGNKTWKDIKNEATNKLKLKEEWPSDSYGIYDWKIGDENGAKVEDSTIITKNMVIFARSTFTAYYYNTDNGEKKLVGPMYGTHMRGNIIIPHDVTIIVDRAFSTYNYGITKFDFSECRLLKEIQDGVHSALSAFSGCFELETVDFSGCTNLEKIGNYAFASCTKLKSITFEGCTKLASIGKEAFSYRLQLEVVDFSNCTNLNAIDDSVFLGCSKLESINLTGCTNLETIGVDAFGNTNISSLDFLSPCTKLKSISGFSGCKGLIEVNFSNRDSLETIEEKAFYGCTNLTSVKFSNCRNLTGVSGPSYYDDKGIFTDCSKLESVDFSGCSNLKGITRLMFKNCVALKTLNFENRLALIEIQDNAFENCISLNNDSIRELLSSLKNLEKLSGFNNCTGITNLFVPSPIDLKLKKIGGFTDCTNLKTVNLFYCMELESIEREAFSNCSNLKEISLTGCKKLRNIKPFAFNNCSKLEKIDFSYGECNTFNIESMAFSGCTEATITLPKARVIGFGYVPNGQKPKPFGENSNDWCKKVIVAHENVKEKIIKRTSYPEERIEVKQP